MLEATDAENTLPEIVRLIHKAFYRALTQFHSFVLED